MDPNATARIPGTAPGSSTWVLGYGSLTATHGADSVPADLEGYSRGWTVAMDNSAAGARHWLLDGARAPGFVAYLDVHSQPGASLNGVAIRVDPDGLSALDAREANYQRIEVTASVQPLPESGATIFTYVGTAAARQRATSAIERGTGRIAAAYWNEVIAGFTALGPEALRRFADTTAAPPFPVATLERRGPR